MLSILVVSGSSSDDVPTLQSSTAAGDCDDEDEGSEGV